MSRETKQAALEDYLRTLPEVGEIVLALQAGEWLWAYDPRLNLRLAPQEFARRLVNDSAFQLLRLGTWMGTPDGTLITQAVATVVPPVYRPPYDLLVQGLTEAAALQARAGRRAAGKAAVLVTVAAAAVWTIARAGPRTS